MNTRVTFSVGIIGLGLILALLPLSSGRSFIVKPQKLLSEVLDEKSYFTVDQVARFIVSEDKTIQIVDLRTPDEFRNMNIPGSINVPYQELLKNDPGNFLSNEKIKTIFYSNGDLFSNSALVIAKGLNFKNVFVMKGGLNEWYNSVMNSTFTEEIISARENADAARFDDGEGSAKQFSPVRYKGQELLRDVIAQRERVAKEDDTAVLMTGGKDKLPEILVLRE